MKTDPSVEVFGEEYLALVDRLRKWAAAKGPTFQDAMREALCGKMGEPVSLPSRASSQFKATMAARKAADKAEAMRAGDEAFA